jgi:hypothetical protein
LATELNFEKIQERVTEEERPTFEFEYSGSKVNDGATSSRQAHLDQTPTVFRHDKKELGYSSNVNLSSTVNIHDGIEDIPRDAQSSHAMEKSIPTNIPESRTGSRIEETELEVTQTHLETSEFTQNPVDKLKAKLTQLLGEDSESEEDSISSNFKLTKIPDQGTKAENISEFKTTADHKQMVKQASN